MVRRLALDQEVVGSIPTPGANLSQSGDADIISCGADLRKGTKMQTRNGQAEFSVQQVVTVRDHEKHPAGLLYIGRDDRDVIQVTVASYISCIADHEVTNRYVLGMEEALCCGPVSYAEVCMPDIEDNVTSVAAQYLQRLLPQADMLMACSCPVTEWCINDPIVIEVYPPRAIDYNLDEEDSVLVTLNRAGVAQEIRQADAIMLSEAQYNLGSILELAEESISPSPNGYGCGGAVCHRCGNGAGFYWVGSKPLEEWVEQFDREHLHR